MTGKIEPLENRKARRERQVYMAVVDALQQTGMTPAQGIAILLHLAVALAEEVGGGTTTQMRLVQRAMVDELDRTFNRAVKTQQDDDPMRPMTWWQRFLFGLRMRHGLRWRT